MERCVKPTICKYAFVFLSLLPIVGCWALSDAMQTERFAKNKPEMKVMVGKWVPTSETIQSLRMNRFDAWGAGGVEGVCKGERAAMGRGIGESDLDQVVVRRVSARLRPCLLLPRLSYGQECDPARINSGQARHASPVRSCPIATERRRSRVW